MESKRFTLSSQDVNKWSRNIFLFLAPLLLIYLTFVAGNINDNGFQWGDFIPNLMIQGAMVLYIVNAITDLLRKFLAGK